MEIARDQLKDNARLLARNIQANAGVTAEQKTELGLTVKADPTSINPPTMKPQGDIVAVSGRTVTAQFHDPENPTRRGKPDGVAGIAVFSHVGTSQPPDDPEAWTFQGNTTRTRVSVEFDSSVPGSATVWLRAFYFNPRMQSGPASDPVSTNLQAGSAMAA